MEASGVVGLQGTRRGRALLWVPAWWPRGDRWRGGLFLGFSFLRETGKSKKEERGKMRKRGRGSKFIITNFASGRGPGPPPPPAGCACGQSDSSQKSQTEEVWVEAQGLALCDHKLFHRQEAKGVTEGLCCSWGTAGSADRLPGQARAHRTSAHRAERGSVRARASFVPAGGWGRCRACSQVLFVLAGPLLPLDTPSGSRGVAEDLPPSEERCFGGRGREGPSEPVRLPHEAGLCGQSRR